MSLLSDAMESCTILNKTTVNDGYGGYKTTWTDGATFQAAVVFDSSMQARIAEKQGVTSLYSVITRKKDYILEYHDVFRRNSDGKVFRVTSDADDKKTPPGPRLDMRVCTAEEWVLNG